jgi:hypothetical protein
MVGHRIGSHNNIATFQSSPLYIPSNFPHLCRKKTAFELQELRAVVRPTSKYHLSSRLSLRPKESISCDPPLFGPSRQAVFLPLPYAVLQVSLEETNTLQRVTHTRRPRACFHPDPSLKPSDGSHKTQATKRKKKQCAVSKRSTTPHAGISSGVW